MPDFKFACPQCEQNIQCDVKHAGRQIQCPSCNHLIRIPPPPETTPSQYQAESGMTWKTFIPQSAKPKDDEANR